MIMDFYKFAELLDEHGPTPEILADIIEDHSSMRDHIDDNIGRYKQAKQNTPILTREFEGAAGKVNNKLANDYFGEIVDTKVGYMFGAPFVMNYDRKAPNFDVVSKTITRFKTANNIDDLNAEWCKFASIGGYDAGLVYIDKEGQERVMQVNGNETIIISKTNITEPEYGLIYYKTWNEKSRVEFYDSKNKYIFEGADFSAASLKLVKTEASVFDYCPLFGIPNNNELMGDGDKVFTLIDGYDRSFSDMNSEIEQFRLAYMIFIGYEIDEETLQNMMKTGALYIPEAGNGEGIEWLTKQLDPAYIDSHLDRLEANITRFAKHVNLTDASFGRDITGPAMRYKLFALETKSKYFERKHQAAMLYMFKVLGSAWAKKGIAFDYTMMDFKYTRNIPVNTVDEANAATTLAGITSKRTALGTLTFINDVDEELEQIKREQEEMIDLDNIDLNEDKKKDKNNNGQ